MYKLFHNKFFKVVLPNMVIVATCMLITLLILNYYNPLMGFLTRGMSIGFLVIYGVLIVVFVATFIIRVCTAKSVANKTS